MESKIEYYSRIEDEIIKTYKEADASDDQETKNAARQLMKQHELTLFERESLEFFQVYTAYREASKNGNRYPDFTEGFTPEKTRMYVEVMRKNGIKRFTYSSSWTSSLRGAWEFEQAGAKLEGLIEINTCYNTKAPALQFVIQ